MMSDYQGIVERYDLQIYTPSVSVGYTRVIHLHGPFGIAFLNFVPSYLELGTTRMREDRVFDLSYWDTEWDAVVDMLRNEGPVNFHFEDVRNYGSLRTANEAVGEGEPPAAP